jgi:hypothetical protein
METWCTKVVAAPMLAESASVQAVATLVADRLRSGIGPVSLSPFAASNTPTPRSPTSSLRTPLPQGSTPAHTVAAVPALPHTPLSAWLYGLWQRPTQSLPRWSVFTPAPRWQWTPSSDSAARPTLSHCVPCLRLAIFPCSAHTYSAGSHRSTNISSNHTVRDLRITPPPLKAGSRLPFLYSSWTFSDPLVLSGHGIFHTLWPTTECPFGSRSVTRFHL